MCCGQKRATMRNSLAQSRIERHAVLAPPAPAPKMPLRLVAPASSAPKSTPETSVALSYLESSPVRVQGLVTGRCYEFSGSQPVQSVDARDAPPLLNTRFFRRA